MSRERRFWLLALLAVVAIFSTLGLAGTLVEELRRRDLFDAASFIAFLVLLAAFAASGIRTRPGWRELWVGPGIAAVYAMVLIRTGIPEVERTHLFEYGLVAVLIHAALGERRGKKDMTAAALAIVATSVIGLVDESVQWLIPDRFFDWRDVVFNAFAAVLAVGASTALAWAQRRVRPGVTD